MEGSRSKPDLHGDGEKNNGPRIMIFSWNNQATRISAVPKSSSSFPLYNEDWSFYETHYPDFFDEIEKAIITYKPDVVVYGSQEDAIPGSYFHSDFLPKKMGDLYYNLQKRTRLMGLGIETYKALKTFDFKLRGLRLSVYTKPHLTGVIELEEREMRNYIGEKGQTWANCSLPFLQSKGAVASYLKIPGIKPIAFVCAHLPFSAESLKEAYLKGDMAIRDKAVQESNISFNYLLRELIFDVKLEALKDLEHKSDIGHIFFFGDLNYRVFSLKREFSDIFLHADREKLHNIYIDHDELYRELKKGKIVIPFEEGLNNQGPMFLPTCKMRKPRKNPEEAVSIDEVFNIGQGQRHPSWSDRILHYDCPDTSYRTSCQIYDRFDEGETMKMSDHAAILGIYTLVRK